MQLQKAHLLLLLLVLFSSQAHSAVTQQDVDRIKSHADAFNASRNYQSSQGPAEYYCYTSGSFLAHKPCSDMPSCRETANLLCSTSGGSCDVEIMATHILEYKNSLDQLNAAYSSFLSAYNSFSASSPANTLNRMEEAFEQMRLAGLRTEQSKLRYPEQISCTCGSDPYQCCVGRCPEARFNYTAITNGKAEITAIFTRNCTDGTRGNQCSQSRPKECVFGDLVDNAARCGCPSGMRPSSNGKTCEFSPCNDRGTIVQNGACSPATIGKKCVNGTLLDLPSECGCPAGQNLTGNTCSCPAVISQNCTTETITLTHEVTYYFDRGFSTTINETYSFPRTTCFEVRSTYTGIGCTELVASMQNATPLSITPYPPEPPQVKTIQCGRCPQICTRNPPTGLQCGTCSCPPNLGFCDPSQNATQTNATGTPAYCENELLRAQLSPPAYCEKDFQCTTGICHNLICTDPSSLTYRIDLFFGWFAELFGLK